MKIKLFDDFKKFAFKGNVIDMAVGIIIGGAFGKIVSSLVNDIIMPILGILIGGIDFSSLRWVISPASDTVKELALPYGAFIQSVTDFLFIAASIFVFIRIINKILRKKEEEPPPVKKDETVLLLEEIRDLLKEKSEPSDL